LIHGYMACVSYVDAQIGKILDSLEAAGIADKTIVVLWGDHGWHLGDHGMWCKHTNFEQATRSPLIIVPAASGNKRPGGKSTSPVEFLDIFPTLCELAGIPAPAAIQGTSLCPVLADPSAKVKPFAVSQYPRGNGSREVVGYAFRDERYRYVRWVPAGGPATDTEAEELYDYATDPLETRNLAGDPAAAGALAAMREFAEGFLRK
jgi:arylsulfatase A-like enzyme